jgi:hypothetical protein
MSSYWILRRVTLVRTAWGKISEDGIFRSQSREKKNQILQKMLPSGMSLRRIVFERTDVSE